MAKSLEISVIRHGEQLAVFTMIVHAELFAKTLSKSQPDYTLTVESGETLVWSVWQAGRKQKGAN